MSPRLVPRGPGCAARASARPGCAARASAPAAAATSLSRAMPGCAARASAPAAAVASVSLFSHACAAICSHTGGTRLAGATGLGEAKQSHCVDKQNKAHLNCATRRGRKRNEALHPTRWKGHQSTSHPSWVREDGRSGGGRGSRAGDWDERCLVDQDVLAKVLS